MWWALANNLILVACCAYAWIAGVRTEKIGALLIFSASVLTWVALRLMAEVHQLLNVGVLVIDVVLLVGLIGLALSTNKYWPLWASGFHIVGITTHAAVATQTDVASVAYAHSIGIWSYLVFFSLALGTLLEGRKMQSRTNDS